jgi:hypothetical protein
MLLQRKGKLLKTLFWKGGGVIICGFSLFVGVWFHDLPQKVRIHKNECEYWSPIQHSLEHSCMANMVTHLTALSCHLQAESLQTTDNTMQIIV